MPSQEFWLVDDVSVSQDVAGPGGQGAGQGWLDIFLFCQLAVVEGEIIITTTGNLDTRHPLPSNDIFFRTGRRTVTVNM